MMMISIWPEVVLRSTLMRLFNCWAAKPVEYECYSDSLVLTSTVSFVPHAKHQKHFC